MGRGNETVHNFTYTTGCITRLHVIQLLRGSFLFCEKHDFDFDLKSYSRLYFERLHWLYAAGVRNYSHPSQIAVRMHITVVGNVTLYWAATCREYQVNTT